MEQTITVSQLTFYIRKIFEAEELLYNISVVGEVSGLKIVRGIGYFDLKDQSSLISCVCFNSEFLQDTKNGDKIIAKGTPGFYAKGGKLNFNVSKVTPFGQGDLFKDFLILKQKLEDEGLFDNAHKKPLPNHPKTVGVITSQTGAVIHDIITVANRRNPGLNIVLYPAKVQGEKSAESIIKALDFFDSYDKVDVVIIARGGGSMEDLWEFNNEALARRIFAFTKPLISAVGHETDFTICDFVADMRAPTPSVAAELVAVDTQSKKQLFLRQVTILKSHLENLLLDYQSQIEDYAEEVLHSIQTYQTQIQHQLSLKKALLEKFNPHQILALGYAKIEKQTGVVTTITQLSKGDNITITLKDGKIKGEILWQT